MTDPPPRGRAFRTAALYTLLVGAPALGVAATLHVGRGLEAPPSVGGTWAVEPGPGACGQATGTLVVAQSGARVDVVYAPVEAGPVALRGAVGGGAAAVGQAGSCERIEIRTARDRARPDTLSATFQTGVCGCRATAVTLVRTPDQPLSGGH